MMRRLVQAVAATALLTAMVLVGLSGVASAGKGGPKGGGSNGTITLVLVDSTDGLAHYGGTVTFSVSTTATTEPWVNLKCFQNKTVVAEGWNGYFDGSLTGRNFVLASPKWTGGAADCTAYLTNPQWVVLASTSFHVYA